MKIGIGGPITVSLLQDKFPRGTQFPQTYSFPLIAALARKLHDRGHSVVVFALSTDVPDTVHFAGAGIEAYICPQRRARWQMADLLRQERIGLSRAMRMSECDVIHAHWTYEFAAAALASGVPHLITAHDNPFATIRYATHPYWVVKPLLGFPVIRRAAHITAVSPYVAGCVRRVRPRADVCVVANGVESHVFELNNLRKNPEAGPVVFAAVLNYWTGLKNGRRLLEAFAGLRTRVGSKVELRVFGFDYGPAGPAATWAKANQTEAGITFCGSVEYYRLLRTLAAEADVLVHPSLEEAHSMVITEAMAIGLPVLAGEHSGGVPWALANGEAGLLVDVRSSAALADGMQTLAENRGMREHFAGRGRELALRSYRIETVVDQYNACLIDAAG